MATTADDSGYFRNYLTRPSSEAATNQRVVAKVPGSFTGQGGLCLRRQPNGDVYLAHFDPLAANQVFFFTIIGGNAAAIQSAALPAGFTPSHSYTCDFQATGTSPTTLTFTVTDATTGAVFTSLTTTDGAASLQNPGVPALVAWSNPATSQQVTFTEATTYTAASVASLGPLVVGAVGDSITAGFNGDPCGAMASYLTSLGYAATVVNRGIGGTSSADWLPSGSDLPAAIAAFQAAGVTVVQVMLGTNDVRTPNSFTVAQHAANMRAIVGALRAAGFLVVLHKPLFTVPNVGTSPTVWPADSSSLYRAYFAADSAMADGVGVFIGDSGNFQQSALSPGTFLESGGVHPANAAANTAVGQFWAVALLNRYAPASARWTHS